MICIDMKVIIHRIEGLKEILVKVGQGKGLEVLAPCNCHISDIDRAVKNNLTTRMILNSPSTNLMQGLNVSEHDRHKSGRNDEVEYGRLSAIDADADSTAIGRGNSRRLGQRQCSTHRTDLFVPPTAKMYAMKECLLHGNVFQVEVGTSNSASIDYKARVIRLPFAKKVNHSDRLRELQKVVIGESRIHLPVLASKISAKLSVCPTNISVRRLKWGWGNLSKQALVLDIQLVQLPFALQMSEIAKQLTKLITANKEDYQAILKSSIPDFQSCTLAADKYLEYKELFG